MGPEKIVLGDYTEYRLNGKLHREDGPAVTYNDGDKMWFRHGQWHREDGPAVIWKDGSEVWYLYDICHREDGPAFISKDGTKKWYIGGIELTKEEAETSKQIFSGEYPFEDLPLLINHPTLKYFALRKLAQNGTY